MNFKTPIFFIVFLSLFIYSNSNNSGDTIRITTETVEVAGDIDVPWTARDKRESSTTVYDQEYGHGYESGSDKDTDYYESDIEGDELDEDSDYDYVDLYETPEVTSDSDGEDYYNYDDGDGVYEDPNDGDGDIYEDPNDGDEVYEDPNYGDEVYEDPNYGDGVYEDPNGGDGVYEDPNGGDGIYEDPNGGDIYENYNDGDDAYEDPDEYNVSDWEDNDYSPREIEYDEYENDEGQLAEDMELGFRKRRATKVEALVCNSHKERQIVNRISSLQRTLVVLQKRLNSERTNCQITTTTTTTPTTTTPTTTTQTTTTPTTTTATTTTAKTTKARPTVKTRHQQINKVKGLPVCKI